MRKKIWLIRRRWFYLSKLQLTQAGGFSGFSENYFFRRELKTFINFKINKMKTKIKILATLIFIMSLTIFTDSKSNVTDKVKSAGKANFENTSANLMMPFPPGNVNSDLVTDVEDLMLVEIDVANFVSGVVPTDLNGDNFVDLTDFLIVYNLLCTFPQ